MSEDNDLPANAAVRLAVMTGRPVAEFEPDAAIPDLPTVSYPPTTHHRLAEGLPVVRHPESDHYV